MDNILFLYAYHYENNEIKPESLQSLESKTSMFVTCYRKLIEHIFMFLVCVCLLCRLYIDGPFGSPFEESLNYEVSLCVAGGIGVTPFASILNTLLYVILICFVSSDKTANISITSLFRMK